MLLKGSHVPKFNVLHDASELKGWLDRLPMKLASVSRDPVSTFQWLLDATNTANVSSEAERDVELHRMDDSTDGYIIMDTQLATSIYDSVKQIASVKAMIDEMNHIRTSAHRFPLKGRQTIILVRHILMVSPHDIRAQDRIRWDNLAIRNDDVAKFMAEYRKTIDDIQEANRPDEAERYCKIRQQLSSSPNFQITWKTWMQQYMPQFAANSAFVSPLKDLLSIIDLYVSDALTVCRVTTKWWRRPLTFLAITTWPPLCPQKWAFAVLG